MPQRRKTLLERVERNSFRADRYANLLHGEWLPLDAPGWADRELWWRLRLEQGWYREPRRLAERELHAARFSRLVRALHGGPVPGFALGSAGQEPVPSSFNRNPEYQRWMDVVLRVGRAREPGARR